MAAQRQAGVSSILNRGEHRHASTTSYGMQLTPPGKY
jgi:hypothetical protein